MIGSYYLAPTGVSIGCGEVWHDECATRDGCDDHLTAMPRWELEGFMEDGYRCGGCGGALDEDPVRDWFEDEGGREPVGFDLEGVDEGSY